MIRVLTTVAVVMGLLFFTYGVVTGRSLWVNVVFMLGIIVANVPEGLLPTFTLAMSMASLRMARKRVLVKSLEAVETLGAVHVICTDKTGTLTKNKLAIVALVDPISGCEITDEAQVQFLLKAALIASEVRNESANGTHWSGDPLDVVLAERYATRFGSPAAIFAETRRHLPFDLQKRREAGVYANEQQVLFAIKGAWESLRPMIGSVTRASDTDQGVLPVTEEVLVHCDEHVRQLASTGKRVIAVAYRGLATLNVASPSSLALRPIRN